MTPFCVKCGEHVDPVCQCGHHASEHEAGTCPLGGSPCPHFMSANGTECPRCHFDTVMTARDGSWEKCAAKDLSAGDVDLQRTVRQLVAEVRHQRELIGSFARLLRPDQLSAFVSTLDMEQKILLLEILKLGADPE